MSTTAKFVRFKKQMKRLEDSKRHPDKVKPMLPRERIRVRHGDIARLRPPRHRRRRNGTGAAGFAGRVALRSDFGALNQAGAAQTRFEYLDW